MIPRLTTGRFLTIRNGKAAYRHAITIEWLGITLELSIGKARL